MPFDRDELRRVMGHFATGVTVLTTHDGEGKRHYGLTANAVCSVSLDPPLILVCIDKRAESYPAFQDARCFVVNVLGRDQQELSKRFAVSGGDKFTGLGYHAGPTGAAVLDDALAWVDCRIIEEHEGGDHTIYLGEVESAGTKESGDPLVFFRGRYRELLPD